jgi:hypothetical protein
MARFFYEPIYNVGWNVIALVHAAIDFIAKMIFGFDLLWWFVDEVFKNTAYT